MNIETTEKRRYRQTSRAAAAEATAERILDCFTERLYRDWYDEIRLEEVARCAGVTVQTVIRRYGGKDGLLQAAAEAIGREVVSRRAIAAGDAGSVIRALSDDYEQSGDLVIRMLAQEDRHPALKQVTDIGRASHRAWIEAAFAPWLERAQANDRQRMIDMLVVASDVYVWKLVRRDTGRPAGEYRKILLQMLAAALPAAPEELMKEEARVD